MDIEILQYFVVVAKMRHITNAASTLHITQPSLSASIKRLESALGVPLFEKDGRNIKLTPYGQLYYEKIEQALTIIDEANKALDTMKKEAENKLTVCAPSLFAFSGLMNQILAVFPGIKFTHLNLSYPEIIRNLKEGTLDFAITMVPYLDSELQYITLRRQNLLLFVGPQNRFHGKAEISVDEVSSLPYIGSHVASANMEVQLQILNELGIHPQNISHVVSTKDQLSVIGESDYVALLPDNLINSTARNMNLTALRITGVDFIERDLYLVSSRNNKKQTTNSVQHIISNYFQNNP